MPWFKKKEERDLFPLASNSPELIRILGGFGPTLSGVDVTERTALRSMAVWRAVNLTSSTVGSLPLKVYKDSPTGRKEIDNSLFYGEMYPGITWCEGIETLAASILLYGDAYGLIIRTEGGSRIAQVLPLDPGLVSVRRGDQSADNPSGKIYTINGQEFTPYDILQIPGLSFDGLAGMSPISFAREAIGVGLAAEQVAARMFDSGLLSGGYLQAEGELTEDQADEAKRRWKQKNTGVNTAYDVALLGNGYKFIPGQIPPKDAQWLESRHFSVEEIARLFGMPPGLLFEFGATGNIEADKMGAMWLRFGLNQLLVRIEKRLSVQLLPRGQFCEFTREGLLQGTPKEQAEVEAIRIQSGVYTVDEIRAIHNLPPLPKPDPVPVVVVAPDQKVGDPASGEDGSNPPARSAPVNLELRQEPTVVNLPAPIINVQVNPTPVDVVVTNEVNPTPVTIQPATVQVENRVETPVVNIQNDINVPASEAPDKAVKFIRDSKGNVTGAEITDG